MQLSIRGVAGICLVASSLSLASRVHAQAAERPGEGAPPPVEAPAEEAPAEEAPVEEAPGVDVPTGEAPAEDVLVVEEAPMEVVAPPPSGGDLVVIGERVSEAQQLQQSADAVNVIDTRKAREQSADLGMVLARTQGVTVRREGGLGSKTQFTLNGLSNDQVRFFLDGVPLDLAGFPFGMANVPVNLVERVEVYRGVVPIRFGADALGGAVNLVTPDVRKSSLSGSYQVGSFGLHRATLEGRYRHAPSGFVVGGSAFVDVAKNDYDVDVTVPGPDGRLRPLKVRRFHDQYRAYGVNLQVGVTKRPWARRLLVTGFVSGFDKDLQHNLDMTVPYGEVTNAETAYGATARYDVSLSAHVDLELTANYSHRRIDFRDVSEWFYQWTGARTREPLNARGEVIQGEPSDTTLWQDAAFTRALLTWDIATEHILRVSVSPVFTARSGKNHLGTDSSVTQRVAPDRRLLTFVAGLEYELNLFDDRLSNVVFVKDYVYHAESDALPGESALRNNKHRQGVGDALRFRFTPWLYAKASYEYATRLPRPDELFGNGGLVRPNMQLKPEVSHNVNLGPHIDLEGTPIGNLTLDINAFLRESDQLIVLLSDESPTRFRNVYRARGLGLENALSWLSPGQWVSIDGMLTWQDVRNVSSKGDFGSTKGDRVPNRPYLFGSWSARLQLPTGLAPNDSIQPFYYGRYVHSFYRGWESLGSAESKRTIDKQLVHDVGISWLVSRRYARATATFEVQNVADAKVFDNFGVQRPGRAFFGKLTASFL